MIFKGENVYFFDLAKHALKIFKTFNYSSMKNHIFSFFKCILLQITNPVAVALRSQGKRIFTVVINSISY
jgi:hypothetical protein